METALSSGADKEEPACDDASSIEIATHTLDLQGFLQASLQGSFHHRFTRPAPVPSHHPTKSAPAKGESVESCPKSCHGR
jgi:hypothetical protein